MISVACEEMERKALKGEPFDPTVYGTLTGHLSRTLSLLGLKRRRRALPSAITLPSETAYL
jgi:hypothetical protein